MADAGSDGRTDMSVYADFSLSHARLQIGLQRRPEAVKVAQLTAGYPAVVNAVCWSVLDHLDLGSELR